MSHATRAIGGALLGLALLQAPIDVLRAQTPAPPPPPEITFGAEDITLAPAGSYTLDPDHTSVLVRVSHLRYSYSVFRFERVQGKLTWDPAAVTGSSLSAAVETGSVTSPVKGFAEQLAGDDFLKVKAFPQATFVSTAFRQIDPTRGQIDGTFTLMGKSRPVTFDVALVGAGKGFGGHPRIGIEAFATINPQDYGLPEFFKEPMEIVIDTEFARQP